MKEFNLSKGTIYVPLKTGETVTNGAVYEVLEGKAQKVTAGGATGNLLGVCEGGDNIREGYIMLDIDPTSAFTEAYEGSAPTIGTYVDACKLVMAVDTDAKTYTYLVRKEVSGETPAEDSNFKVTFSYSSEASGWVSDKTFSETLEAYEAGKNVYAVLAGDPDEIFPLYLVQKTGAQNIKFRNADGNEIYFTNDTISTRYVTETTRVSVSEESGQYTIYPNYEGIYQAYNADRLIYAVYDNKLFVLEKFDGTNYTFYFTAPGDDNAHRAVMTIDSSDNVTITQVTYTAETQETQG